MFGKQKQKTETNQKTKLEAMKTTSNVQKTENKKVERPVSKFFAVVVSLVLISLTVSANGFWKLLLTNNTFGKMAELMVDQENKNNELLASGAPVFVAHPVDVNHSTAAFYFEPALEKNLKIESWMTNETYFNSSILKEDLVDREKSLEIESWMIDGSYFGSSVSVTDDEPAPKIEAWMLDENFWKN